MWTNPLNKASGRQIEAFPSLLLPPRATEEENSGALCASISSENNQEPSGGDESMAGGSMGLSQRAFRDSEIEFERPGLFIHQPWQALAAQVNICSCLPACLFTFFALSHVGSRGAADFAPVSEGRLWSLRSVLISFSTLRTVPLNNRTLPRCHSNDCSARDIGTL